MKINWSHTVASLVKGGLMLLFYGGVLFYALLMLNFSGWPIYVIRGLSAVGIASLPVVVLAASGFLSKRFLGWLGKGMLLVCAGAAIYMGWGAYNASIPTVDDRDLLLYQYEPFLEDTKAVRLEEPATLQLTEKEANSLRLDGATALYPVYAAFVQAVYPQGEYPRYDATPDGYGLVTCSNTVHAYERLIAGETDIIFVAGPSQAQLEAAEAAGVTLHLTPVGKEAFVFFVNSKNPVTGLTVEQIRGIYSGQITNWKEVGGKNQSIRPFQRAENSGSQTSLQRLMGDLPLLEPETEDRIDAMSGIIRQVASYRNYHNAIGFSFRYYSTQMVADDQIRLLALNGVEPTKETIRDGSYPIASEFYAVTASPIGQPAPQEGDPVMAAFLDWVRSDQGQELVERTGYVSLDG